jgi:hypothetical protein
MRKKKHPSSFSVLGLTTVMASALLFSGTNAWAADAKRGRLLYENHCTVCHTSVVHIRENRKASSLEEIREWVQRWRKELNLQWEPGEVDDVIEYLDSEYYRLKGKT